MPQSLTSALTHRGEQILMNKSDVDYGSGLEDVSQWGRLLGGAALVVYGVTRRSVKGVFLAGIGAGLAYSAAQSSGMLHGGLKRLALHTKASRGVDVETSITIERPVAEVYAFWRELDNLSLFMDHIRSVHEFDRRHSHWIAELRAGLSLAWDAEIVAERENELLAWRSVEGSDIYNEGFVVFASAPGGRGTEVRARITYRPPAGELGAKVAEFFSKVPEALLKEDLRRFKQILEAGEISTTSGQSSGRAKDFSNGGTQETPLH